MPQESNIEIQVSDNGSTWSALTTLPAGATSYSHTGLTPGTTKHYRIRAKGNNSTTSDSNWVTANATTLAAGKTTPDAPTFTGFNDDTNTIAVVPAPGVPMSLVRYTLPGNPTVLHAPTDGIIRPGDIQGSITAWSIENENFNQSPNANSPAFTLNSGTEQTVWYHFEDPGTDQNITLANDQDFAFAVDQPFSLGFYVRLLGQAGQFLMTFFDADTNERRWGIDILPVGGTTHGVGMALFDESGNYLNAYATNNEIEPQNGNPIMRPVIITYNGSGQQSGIQIYVSGAACNMGYAGSVTSINSFKSLSNGKLHIGKSANGYQAKNVQITLLWLAPFALNQTQVTELYNNNIAIAPSAFSFADQLLDAWNLETNLLSMRSTHNGTATTPKYVTAS